MPFSVLALNAVNFRSGTHINADFVQMLYDIFEYIEVSVRAEVTDVHIEKAEIVLQTFELQILV